MLKRVWALILVVISVMGLSACNGNRIKNPYVKEYAIGQGNIKGTVDKDYYAKINADFEIGASKNGDAVFKDPDAAFNTMKELYSDGIEAIQNEFNLSSLSGNNYDDYKIYGWQVTIGSDEEKEQARFVSRFLDIYENSFE